MLTNLLSKLPIIGWWHVCWVVLIGMAVDCAIDFSKGRPNSAMGTIVCILMLGMFMVMRAAYEAGNREGKKK
jgi:hypothetical protein|uniref:Uncharacterized protein n=1 Tax=Myoviridae sp. ctshb19 TaxID=2825194 RepID=A0A8S5UG48_9CAUD|nr:MAG TPA: hypothetical protein [Myoviridae sp. ctshb19]